MQLCMYAAVLLLSWFGARTIVACGGDAATGLSTGELLSLLSYATQILMSLMGLSMIFVMLTMSRTSGERVVELLNETPDITTYSIGTEPNRRTVVAYSRGEHR